MCVMKTMELLFNDATLAGGHNREAVAA